MSHIEYASLNFKLPDDQNIYGGDLDPWRPSDAYIYVLVFINY